MKKAFREFCHYLDVTVHVIKMAVMTIVEYPANIAGWLISNPLQFIMGFAIIRFAVASFGEINGWNYGQLAFLYGISVISHALSMILFVQGWFMGYYVIEGEFDRYLTRPLGVLYQFFFTNVNIIGVTDLIPGILVFAYGCVKCGVKVTPFFFLQVVVMLIGATLRPGALPRGLLRAGPGAVPDRCGWRIPDPHRLGVVLPGVGDPRDRDRIRERNDASVHHARRRDPGDAGRRSMV